MKVRFVSSGLGTCNHLVAWTFAAVFFVVTTSAVAQEQKKTPGRSGSPDGKGEIRAGAAGETDEFVIAEAGRLADGSTQATCCYMRIGAQSLTSKMILRR